MRIGTGVLLIAAVVVLVEVLNVVLGIWSDRLTEYVRRKRQPSPRFPWSDRTGT
jgi:hypothetical protein